MTGGYMGKFLTVDLSAGRIDEEKLDSELCQSLIGGYGIGAKLLYERMGAGCVTRLAQSGWRN